MSLRFVTAQSKVSYLNVSALQDEANPSDFVRWGLTGAPFPRQVTLYYDRTDRMYAKTVGASTQSWIIFDPLALDNSASGLRIVLQPSNPLQGIFVGEWNKSGNIQKLYGSDSASNDAFDEVSSTDLSVITADAFPALGTITHRGALTSTQDGYYDAPALSTINTGGWVFFETLGVALHPSSRVRANGVDEDFVMAVVDLSDGSATIDPDIPTRYTNSPNQFQAPPFGGNTFDLRYIQFVPDDDSTPSAPKGRLILESEPAVVDPNDASLDNLYIAIYDWNPTGVSGGAPNRVHKRLTLLSRLQMKDDTAIASGGIGTYVHNRHIIPFHPPSSTFRLYGAENGSVGSSPPADEITMAVWASAPEVFELTPPTALRRVETNKDVDFSTTVIGDLGEQIAGIDVTFTHARVSTFDEDVGVGDGSTGATAGDFSLDNAPIDLIEDVLSVTVAGTPYTPIAVGTASAGNEVEVNLTNGDLQFFQGGVATNVTGQILATYRHFSTEVTPAHGTLLTGITRSDETGQAFARVRVPDDSDLEDEFDKLDATAEAASSSRIYTIALGSPTVLPDSTVILGAGSQGTIGAKRRLTHPDGVNFPPIVYYQNPDRTFNVDNDVLPHPIVDSVLTAGSTQVVRFERNIEDVVVTEVWRTDRGSASMPTFLLRLLYEYLRNPPPFDANNQTYITWEPRDRNSKTYNIQMLRLVVGSGSEGQEFDIRDVRAEGSVIKSALDDLDTTPSGVLDQPVTLQFRIVGEV